MPEPSNPDLASGNLLASLAVPWELAPSGPDIPVGSTAAGSRGATFLMQNPTAAEMPVRVEIGMSGYSLDDFFEVHLAALEVAALVVPVKLAEFGVRVTGRPASVARIRPRAEESGTAWSKTVATNLLGAAALLSLGVGRFGYTKSGGVVTDLELKIDSDLAYDRGAPITYTRIWAPVDAPPPKCVLYRASLDRPTVRVHMPAWLWGGLSLPAFVLATLLAILTTKSDTSPVLFVIGVLVTGAILWGVAVFVASMLPGLPNIHRYEPAGQSAISGTAGSNVIEATRHPQDDRPHRSNPAC